MSHFDSYSQEEIEDMIEECLVCLDDTPDEFSSFERTFLESIEHQNETGHLTTTPSKPGGKSQVEALVEVYEEHCV